MKNLFISLFFFLCLSTSCQDNQANRELQELKARQEHEEQNIELVKKLFEELNDKNIQFLIDLLDPQYQFYYPSNSSTPGTKEDVNKMMVDGFKAFPDINYTIYEIFAEGDAVIVRFAITATHQDEFEGIPATNNKVGNSGILILKFQNEKIIEEREEADYLGFMQQLGMELQMKEIEE